MPKKCSTNYMDITKRFAGTAKQEIQTDQRQALYRETENIIINQDAQFSMDENMTYSI
jgi:hypothetical protein